MKKLVKRILLTALFIFFTVSSIITSSIYIKPMTFIGPTGIVEVSGEDLTLLSFIGALTTLYLLLRAK